jgi:hypothetical protein
MINLIKKNLNYINHNLITLINLINVINPLIYWAA